MLSYITAFSWVAHVDAVQWAQATDKGYTAPNMVLFLRLQSVTNGLRVSVNGAPLGRLTFSEFGKSTHDVLVEARRGPISYRYSPMVLGWQESCSEHTGINGKFAKRLCSTRPF